MYKSNHDVTYFDTRNICQFLDRKWDAERKHLDKNWSKKTVKGKSQLGKTRFIKASDLWTWIKSVPNVADNAKTKTSEAVKSVFMEIDETLAAIDLLDSKLDRLMWQVGHLTMRMASKDDEVFDITKEIKKQKITKREAINLVVKTIGMVAGVRIHDVWATAYAYLKDKADFDVESYPGKGRCSKIAIVEREGKLDMLMNVVCGLAKKAGIETTGLKARCI